MSVKTLYWLQPTVIHSITEIFWVNATMDCALSIKGGDGKACCMSSIFLSLTVFECYWLIDWDLLRLQSFSVQAFRQRGQVGGKSVGNKAHSFRGEFQVNYKTNRKEAAVQRIGRKLPLNATEEKNLPAPTSLSSSGSSHCSGLVHVSVGACSYQNRLTSSLHTRPFDFQCKYQRLARQS